MSDNQPHNKPKEKDQDLGFAMALAQSISEPMDIEKDAANAFFKRFLKHTLSMEKFSKKLLLRFQRVLESLIHEENKASLDQIEFLLQITWLFAANLHRQKNLPKDLWRLMFSVIGVMLEFFFSTIQFLSKQISTFQKKNEEQPKEKKLEDCLMFLQKALKSLYQQSSSGGESNEEFEKLKNDVSEALKKNELLQSLRIPHIEVKEIDFYLSSQEVIDMDKILEFSMILKIGEDSELFSQMLSSQITDFMLKREGFLDSIEELLRNSLQISSFSNQIYQDFLTWLLNLEKVKEEIKLVLALRFSIKVLSEPRILSRKESILEWIINFIQQTSQIPAIFKVKFYLNLLKETIKHLAKIYTIDNDNMITLEICDLVFFNISQLNFDSNHLNNLEVNYYLEFLENIYQIFLIIKQEKNLSISDQPNPVTVLKPDQKENKDVANNSMKSEEILNQSGEQMLEISEISSVVGMESEMKDQTKDGLNLKNMLLSEYNISKEEKPNKSKMNVLDEYSFDDFQGSLIKRDVNISKTEIGPGVAILEKSRNQIEKLTGILKNVKRVFEKFLKEDNFLEQIQKALDKKLFRKFLELIEECLTDQIFRRLAESLSEILSMILGKNLAFEKGFFNDFLLYLIGNLTEAGFNKPFNFSLIFTILAQVLKETMVKRPGIYEENLTALIENLMGFYLCSEKEGVVCKEYHLFLFASLIRGISEEKRLRVLEKLISYIERQLRVSKFSQFFEQANGYLAILIDGLALNFNMKSMTINFNALLLDLITKRVDLEKSGKFGDSISSYFTQRLDHTPAKNVSMLPQSLSKEMVGLKKLVTENLTKFEALVPQKHRFYLLLKNLDEITSQEGIEFSFVFERLNWLESCNSLWRADLTIIKLQEVFKEFCLLYENPASESQDLNKALKVESGLHLLLIKLNNIFTPGKKAEIAPLLTPEFIKLSYLITKTLNQEIQKETNTFLNTLINTYNEEELLNLREFNSDFGLFFLAVHNFARLTDLDIFPILSKVFVNEKLRLLLKIYCKFDQEIKGLPQAFLEKMVNALKKHDIMTFFSLQTQLCSHSLEILSNETLILDIRRKPELELQNSSNRLIFLMLLMNEMLALNQKIMGVNKNSPFSKLQNLDLWFLELQYLQNKSFQKDGYLKHIFEEDCEEKKLVELHALLIYAQKFKVFYCCANAFARLVVKLREKNSIVLQIEKIFRKVLLELLEKQLNSELGCEIFSIGLIKESQAFWASIFEPRLANFLITSLINCPKPEAENALENLIVALMNYPLKKPRVKREPQSMRTMSAKIARKGLFPLLRFFKVLTRPQDFLVKSSTAAKSSEPTPAESKQKSSGKTEKKKLVIEKKKEKVLIEKKKQFKSDALEQPIRKKEKKRVFDKKKPNSSAEKAEEGKSGEQGLFKSDALVKLTEIVGVKIRGFFLESCAENSNLSNQIGIARLDIMVFLLRSLNQGLGIDNENKCLLLEKMDLEKEKNLEGIVENEEMEQLENSNASISFEQKSRFESSEELSEAVISLNFKEILGFFKALLVLEPEVKDFPELLLHNFGFFLMENIVSNETLKQSHIEKWTDFLNFTLSKVRNLDRAFLSAFIPRILDFLFQEQDPLSPSIKPQLDYTPFLILLAQFIKFESGEHSQSMLIEDSSKGILSPILEEKPSRKNSLSQLQEKMLVELFPMLPKDIQGEPCTYTQNLKTKEKFIPQHYYQCYTCDLKDGKGCCTVCAYKCHFNHQVVYCRKAEFFCDCGSGSNCLCMKPVDNKEDFPSSRLAFNHPRPDRNKNAFLDLSIGSEKNLASLNMGFMPKEPSELVEKFEKVETGNNLEFLVEEQAGEKFMWMEASEEEKPRIEESSSESEEREFQLIEENNPESSQARYMRIKSLVQKLQGIDPNISISGLLGDKSKDMGLLGGLLRKTLRKEVLFEKELFGNMKKSVGNNMGENQVERQELMIDESLNISYAPINEDDGRSVDSNNTSMVMESANLISFKKNNAAGKGLSPISSSQAKAHLINLVEPLKAENFFRILMEKQEKNQMDLLSFLSRMIVQALEKLIAGFAVQKPTKASDNIQSMGVKKANIDWSFKFSSKLEHLLELKPTLICKMFSQSSFDYKSRFDNALINDKRMLSFLVLTNPPFRNPFEYIANKGLILIAEGDKFSVFERSAFLSGIFEPWNQALVNKPGIKASQYFYQYELSPDNSAQTAFLNETAAPPKPVFKSQGLGFPIVSLLYSANESSMNQTILIAVGLNNLNVLHLDKTFTLTKRLTFDNKIPQDYIIKVIFLPNAENFLAVLTLRSLKILNLQAENYPVTLVRFTLLDQTLFKDFTFMESQSNPKEKRLFVSSNDGNLYTHTLNVDELQGLNEEELILVENIYFSPESKPNGKSISSVNYFAQSQLLICGFEDGNSLAGKFTDKELEIINIVRIKPGDVSNNKGVFEPFLQKQGQIISQVKEVYVDEEQAKYAAMLRKGNTIFPVSIKMTKNAIIYQPLLPPNPANSIKSEGICIVPYYEKGISLILEATEDGALYAFIAPFDEGLNLKTLRSSEEKLPPILKKKEKVVEGKLRTVKDTEIDSYVHNNYSLELINMLIPCKVFLDFPERFQSLNNKIDLNSVSLLEDFLTQLPPSNRNFRSIANLLKEPPFVFKADRQTLTLGLGFGSKDWVVCGLRMRIGIGDKNNDLKVRVFERELGIPLDKGKGLESGSILDIALTEPEIVYVYLQGQIEFEMLTSSNKPMVILFFGVELYGCSQNEFNMKQKINVLGQILRLNMKESESPAGNRFFNEKSFKSIQSGLLNTKILANNLDMHIKSEFLRNEVKANLTVKTINLIDTFALFLIWLRGSRNQRSTANFEGLLDPLKNLLLEEKVEKYLKCSIKRLIRAILSLQERGLDYEGFKDIARIEFVTREFHQPGLSCEKVLGLFSILSKIWTKRYGNILLLFSKSPDFPKEVHAFLLNVLKSHSKDLDESTLESLVSKSFKLMFLHYQFLKNQAVYRAKTSAVQKQSLELDSFFKSIWELFDAADLDQRVKLSRILIDSLKPEILGYSEEALSFPMLVSLPKDVFECGGAAQSAPMEIEKMEENEEDLMNLAIELSLKDPRTLMKPQEKERVVFEIQTFEIFSDFFENLLRKIGDLSSTAFEEFAGAFFYMLYQTVNLPMNYLMNKIIAGSFSGKLDRFIQRLFELVFGTLEGHILTAQDQRPPLCFMNLLVNFLKYLNRSPSLIPEEKPAKTLIRAETPIRRKHSTSIDQNIAPSPLKVEMRTRFLMILKSLESTSGLNFSALILRNLEELNENFVSNKGSLRFEFTQGVFQETFKKAGNEPNPKYLNDKTFTESWKTVFKKSEILKKGNGIFHSLDQSIYGSLVSLMLNLINLGYRDFEEENWLRFVCKSLIRPPTYLFAINNVKKIRNLLYKEQSAYNENFDEMIYQLKFEFLSKVYEASNNFRRPLTYDQMQFLLRTLNTLSRHSSKRPQVWSNFNLSVLNLQMLKMLIETFPLNINEITENCLHLLAAYLTPLQLEEKASKLLSKGSKDYEELINKIIENGLSIKCKTWFPEVAGAFDFIVSQVFLESNSKSLRMNSLKFLIALWFAGEINEKEILMKKMLGLSRNLMTYGNNVEHYLLFINFLGCFLKNSGPEANNLKNTLTEIYWQLTRSFIELKDSLKRHKNFEIYRDLYDFLFDFNESTLKAKKMNYYFEMNGCLKCYELMNSPYHELKLTEITETKPSNHPISNPISGTYQDFKFDTFKYSEKKIKFNENVKFTGNSIIAKLNNTYELDSITVVILENYKIRKAVKSINISINNRIINDILDLKNLKSEWKFVKSQTIDEKSTNGSRKNVKISFSIPVTARNLKIEFFMSQLKGESMFGNCDVCGSALLEDKYLGTFCLTCKERNREKQCPCCYNIIYEKNDSIFCVPDCGYCKFFDYEIMVSARIGSKIEKIESSKAKDDCMKTLSKILTQINDDSRALFKKRQNLDELIKVFRSGDVTPELAQSILLQQSDPGPVPRKPGHSSQPLKSSHNSLIQEISRIYTREISGLYEQIMKNVTSVIVSRKALFLYARSEGDSCEGNLNLFEKGATNACFGCNMNYLSHLLRFFGRSNNGIAEVNSELVFNVDGGLMRTLTETLIDSKLFNEMRNKARKAVVHLIGNHPKSLEFVDSVIRRPESVYKSLLVEILKSVKEKIFVLQLNESVKRKNQGPVEAAEQEYMLGIFRKGIQSILLSLGALIEEAKRDSNCAQKCLFPILVFIQKEFSYSDLKEIIRKLMKSKELELKDKELVKDTTDLMDEEKDQKDSKDKKSKSFYEEVMGRFKHSLGVDVKKTLLYENLLQKVDKPETLGPEGIALKIHKTIYHGVLLQNDWISACLRLTNYQNIHSVICGILKDLFQNNEKLVLSLMMKNLQPLLSNELETQAYFELFRNLLKKHLSNENKAFEPGFLVYLLENLINAVDLQLRTFKLPQFAQNELYLMNIDIGFGLNETLELIFLIVKHDSKPLQTLKRKSPHFLKFIIRDLLIVRRLSIIKNQQFSNLDANLLALFNEFHSQNISDKRVMLTELSMALFAYQKDLLAEVFICEQIVSLIEPVKKKYSILLILEKKRSQDDYIKGSMKSNPYQADDIGTTFKHIRSRLYRDLELKFDENEPFFELLVNDQIISVDLPIALVYEKVWIPHIMNLRNLEEGSEIPKDIPPMKIMYRIAGFEGEATENRIDRLNEDDQQNKDPEKRYEIAKVLLEPASQESPQTSISLLLSRMKNLNSTNESMLIVGKLLLLISQVHAIREKIIELNGVGVLLNALLGRFGRAQSAENDQIIEILIGILENIVVTSEKQAVADRMQLENEGEEEESLSYLNLSFKKLEELNQIVPKPEKTIAILTRILPFLAKDHLQSNVNLIERYIGFLDFQLLEPSGEMEKFIGIIEVLPKKFFVLRDLCLKYGIYDKLLAFFNELIPNENEINQSKLQDHQTQLTLALKLIRGMILNHKANQFMLFQTRILIKIKMLSHTSIKIKEIGKLAEIIVEYLLQSDPKEIDPKVLEFLKQLVDEEKLQKKKLAELKKQELLKAMKKGNKFLSEEKEKKMEIEEEEKSITCIICHEGYKLNPKSLLGVYLFSKTSRIPDEKIFLSDLLVKEVSGVGSVTHFNCIHLKCHNAAAKAELNMKKPKKEWEGAIIRNSHTKCNNWFPLRGEGVPLGEYESGVLKYFVSTESLIRNETQSQSWIVLNDLKNLMMKFGKQESLSKESKGGSYEHNAKIIPFYFQMIVYLVGKEDPNKWMDFNECLNKLIQGKVKEPTADQVYLCLTMSLLLMGDKEFFGKYRPSFFEMFLRIAREKKEEKPQKIAKNAIELACFKDGGAHEILGKYPEFLMNLRPLLIFMSLISEIFSRIHSRFDASKDISKSLEEELIKNYDSMIKRFEEISTVYRNEIVKITSVEEFCVRLGLVGKKERAAEELKGILDLY